MSKLKLDDTFLDVMIKMSEGNPGALSVLMQLMERGGVVDPDAMLGGMACVLDLDELGLYGPQIWILYKDRLGEDITALITVLRAWQLGFISEDLIKNPDYIFDMPFISGWVQERLPNFNKGD